MIKINIKIENIKNKVLKKKYIFIVLLIISIILFFVYLKKINHDYMDSRYIEVSFTNPTQAIIFWRSDSDVIGYVKYGKELKPLDNIEYQTSSDPNQTHAVIIDNVPIGGYYYQIYEDPINPLINPEILELKYSE